MSVFIHVLVVTARDVLLIRRDVDLGAGRDRDVRIADRVASSDLRALGVKGNGNRTTALDLLSLAGVVDDGLVVLVRPVGEVHANDIEAGLAELVDGLDRVRLGANGADDGGPTVVLGGLEFGVELGEPRNLGGAGAEVVKSGRHVESRRRGKVVRMVRGDSACEKERKMARAERRFC